MATFVSDLENWLDYSDFYYEKEVSCYFFNKIVRPDYVIYTKNKKRIVIEYKNSLPDLNSGRGLNFIGDYNFIACDENLITEVETKLINMKRNDVGILIFKNNVFLTYKKSFQIIYDEFNFISIGEFSCNIDSDITFFKIDNKFDIDKRFIYEHYNISFSPIYKGKENICKYYILGNEFKKINTCIAAAQVLGIEKRNVIFLDFSDKNIILPSQQFFKYYKLSDDINFNELNYELKNIQASFVIIYSNEIFNQDLFNFTNFCIFQGSNESYEKFNLEFNIDSKCTCINDLPDYIDKSNWRDNPDFLNKYERIFKL